MHLKLVGCLALCTYARLQKLECHLQNELNEEKLKIETLHKNFYLWIGSRKADLYCRSLWVSKMCVLILPKEQQNCLPPKAFSTLKNRL